MSVWYHIGNHLRHECVVPFNNVITDRLYYSVIISSTFGFELLRLNTNEHTLMKSVGSLYYNGYSSRFRSLVVVNNFCITLLRVCIDVLTIQNTCMLWASIKQRHAESSYVSANLVWNDC